MGLSETKEGDEVMKGITKIIHITASIDMANSTFLSPASITLHPSNSAKASLYFTDFAIIANPPRNAETPKIMPIHAEYPVIDDITDGASKVPPAPIENNPTALHNHF